MTDDKIDVETIAAGETLMGVAYSRPERELMLDNIEGQIAAAQARRKLVLPNGTPMAARFDFRLAGFPTLPPQSPLRPSNADPGPLPVGDDNIAFAPVSRLSQWIARGALTSRRLTEIYLARVAQHASVGMLRDRDGRSRPRRGGRS